MVASIKEIREIAALAIPIGNSSSKTERKSEELHRIKRIEKRGKRRNLPGVAKNRAKVLLFRPPDKFSMAKLPCKVQNSNSVYPGGGPVWMPLLRCLSKQLSTAEN